MNYYTLSSGSERSDGSHSCWLAGWGLRIGQPTDRQNDGKRPTDSPREWETLQFTASSANELLAVACICPPSKPRYWGARPCGWWLVIFGLVELRVWIEERKKWLSSKSEQELEWCRSKWCAVPESFLLFFLREGDESVSQSDSDKQYAEENDT